MKRYAIAFVVALLCAASLSAQPVNQWLVSPHASSLVPADYNGDGKADVAIAWIGVDYLMYWTIRIDGGATPENTVIQWGVAGDMAAPGDYDGDGKADIAVVRRQLSEDGSVWFIRLSTGGMLQVTWGSLTDTPAPPADYDGDGRTDIAIYRASTGAWWILKSGCNFTCSEIRSQI